MTNKVLYVQGDADASSTTSAGASRYFCLGGTGSLGTGFAVASEARAQVLQKNAGDFSNLSVNVQSNGIAASTVCTFRINGTDGNMSVSVPASTAGVFDETSQGGSYHTDSVVANDKTNLEVTAGGSSGTIALNLASVAFKNTSSSDTIARLCNTYYASSITAASTTYYEPVGGEQPTTLGTTENNAKCRFRKAGTVTNAGVYVRTNGRSTNTTLTLRKNATNTSLVITVPGDGTTGWVEDTNAAHNVSVAVGDDLDWAITTDTGTGTFAFDNICADYVNTAGWFPIISATTDSASQGDNQIRYTTLGGYYYVGTTMGDVDSRAGVSYTFAELAVWVTANDVSSASNVTLMVGSENAETASALVASITGNTSGQAFVDSTHTVTVNATDYLVYRTTVPSVSGNHSITVRSVVMWGQDQSVDLTRVTHYNTLKYNLIGRVVHSNTLKYNLWKQILHSNTLKYNLWLQVKHANTLKYNLWKLIIHPNTLKYNLIGRVVHSQTLKYHLLKQILHANTLQYKIWLQVKHANTLKYNVWKQVTKSNTLLWNIVGSLYRITQQNILKYNLAQRQTHANTLRYNLLKQATKANTLRYNLIGRIIHSNTLRYNVLKQITKSNTLRYNLIGRIIHSNTLKYNLRQFVRSLQVFDDFESGTYSFTEGGNSPNNKWTNDYLGGTGATSGVRYSATAGNNVMWQRPQVSTAQFETHATLNLSSDTWADFDLTFKQRTVSQLRQNFTPNTWETAWLIFRYTDDWHHYYLAFKTNGVEFGRKDYFPHVEQQMFLATPGIPAFQIGSWYTVRLRAIKNHFTVWVDGAQVIDMTDDGSVGYDSQTGGLPPPPTAAMYHGKIGPYNEDAEVEFNDIATLPVIRYNLLKQVLKSNSLKYNLLKQITKANTLLWNLVGQLARITNSNTLKYNLIQRQIHTNTLKYNIANQVTKANILKYSLWQQITNSKILKYNLLKQVTKQNSLLYNLAQQVIKQNSLLYNLRIQVVHANTLKYSLHQLITKANTLKYNIIQASRTYDAQSTSIHVGSLSTTNLDYEVEP